MTTSVPTKAQLEQMSRDAKKLSREESISHTAALDRLAQRRGYKNWSLLAKAANQTQVMPPGADAAPRMSTRQRAAKAEWLASQLPTSAIAARLGHKAVRATDYYARPTLGPGTLNDMRAVFKHQFENQLMDASRQAATQAGLVEVPRIRPCPRCGERERIDTWEHPGTCYVQCDVCGHRGPEVLPNRSRDNWKRHTLRAIIIGWNSEVVDHPAARAARRAKALEAVHASGDSPTNTLKTHAESLHDHGAQLLPPTAEPAVPTPTDASVKPGEPEDN